MTNREWMELIAKEFNVSNSVAKGMLSAMYKARKYLKIPKAVHKKEAEEHKRFIKMCEEEDFNAAFDLGYESNPFRW